MLPKSISPRFVRFTSIATALLLFFPFILLEHARIKLLARRKNQPTGDLCGIAAVAADSRQAHGSAV